MNVTSTLETVTIYREGAVCQRRALLDPAADGASAQVRFVGLPLSLAPGSLRARVLSGPTDLRVLGVLPDWEVTLAEVVDVPAEARALELARDTLSRLELELEGLDGEIAEIEGLRPSFLAQRKGAPPRDAPVSAMIALADFVDARLIDRLARRRKLAKEVSDAQEEVRLGEHRLAEAGTARRTERSRLARCAIVTLSAKPTHAVELAVEYQVPGARWAPNYHLRLERGLGGGALTMRASVAQQTGEDWTGVKLALSTASLSRRGDAPELKALKLGRSQPTPPRSGWREPPPGLDELFAGYDEVLSVGSGRTEGTAAPRAGSAQDEPPPHGVQRYVGRGLVPRRECATAPEAMALGGAAKKDSSQKRRGAPGGPPPVPPSAPAAMPAKGMLENVGAARSHAEGVTGGLGRQVRPEKEQARSSMAFEASDSLADGQDFGGARNDGAPQFGEMPEQPGLDTGLLDYDRLAMGPLTDRSARGRLKPTSSGDLAFVAVSVQVEVVMALVHAAQDKAAALSHLTLPALHQPVVSLDSFDYRYDCDQRVDVASTGKWTTVPVMACQVILTPEYVCVPSVEPRVYRTLQIKNATPHALLAGPVDVSTGEEFLMTTSLPAIPPGADQLRLGLGVEEAVKVARKTRYKESAGGFLGGSTVLPHEIEIELSNRLAVPAAVEVRERVPVAGFEEKDVKVEEASVTPPWEKVDVPLDGAIVPGLRRWRVTVAAGGKATLLAQFSIRIPADRMLVGGNRRA